MSSASNCSADAADSTRRPTCSRVPRPGPRIGNSCSASTPVSRISASPARRHHLTRNRRRHSPRNQARGPSRGVIHRTSDLGPGDQPLRPTPRRLPLVEPLVAAHVVVLQVDPLEAVVVPVEPVPITVGARAGQVWSPRSPDRPARGAPSASVAASLSRPSGASSSGQSPAGGWAPRMPISVSWAVRQSRMRNRPASPSRSLRRTMSRWATHPLACTAASPEAAW